MTIQEFKTKHSDLINRGVIRFSDEHPYFAHVCKEMNLTGNEKNIASSLLNKPNTIIIDRFADDNQTILADKNEILSPRRDVLKIGYTKTYGIGVYQLL
jgi:hypothetical protein